MKRQQRVLQHLAKCCAEQGRGFSAAELAVLTGVARHNISADLNQLWREGLVVKLPGRPVIFWERADYQRVHDNPDTPDALPHALAAVHAAGSAPQSAARSTPEDPLLQLIGAHESLRSQVEQAKAAILYPPAGLHTLLVGPTGVGKSHLAELMHAFGLVSGRLRPGAAFVTLNCADYANNPQLLMAHLFGAMKGAYTGADKERPGLVDQADGGILFLDEVHRLPAEGQEMLFRLLDKGLYRRLGETGGERHASIMLIAATTERIDSALLRTFTRRIPMVITLPSLAERTAAERLGFVRRYLRAEATKIGVDMVLPRETLRMLLEYECLGNIGQLHNDIQLACARLFLSYLTHKREPIELLPVHLPEHIHRTTPPARHQRVDVADLVRGLGDRLLIQRRPPTDDVEAGSGPFSFYGLIEQQMQDLRRQGMSSLEAEKIVRENISGHFQDFVEQVRRRHHSQRQELSKLVGHEVLHAVERGLLWAEERLGRALPERLVYALALHIHASRERIQSGRTLDYHLQPPVVDALVAEAATGLVALLERELGCSLPASDTAFVAMLLKLDDQTPAEQQVGIVVLAHGRVASAIAEVSQALTGTDLACAIDLPLDEEPAHVQEQLVAMAQAGRFPGGLLVLADMGSLETMGEAVFERTGVHVRTIGMASTPLVVEAVHQATVPGATLDQVYHAVLTARAGTLERDGTLGLPQVILTFCFTGAGSAHTLARIVREALAQHAHRVEVIPASIGVGAGWNRLVSTLLRSHRLLAAVGPFHPRIPGVPHISTEEIVVGQGARRLRQLVEEGAGGKQTPPETPAAGEPASIFVQMATSLGEHLKITNPTATVPVVLRGLTAMEQYLGRPLDDALRVGLTMHLVCLLDRKVGDRLLRESAPAAPTAHRGRLPWLWEALQEMMVTFHIQLSSEELERLDEIIGGSVLA